MLTNGASLHARARAAERYGLAGADWNQALLDIIDAACGERRSGLLLSRERSGAERWLIRVSGVAVVAAYAPDSAVIMSIVPAAGRQAPDKSRQWIRGRARRERSEPMGEIDGEA